MLAVNRLEVKIKSDLSIRQHREYFFLTWFVDLVNKKYMCVLISFFSKEREKKYNALLSTLLIR